jgi:drug/metabolite transporter (DMT)-like permease
MKRPRCVYIYSTLISWVCLSTVIIFVNKQILVACHIPFLLALCHMVVGGCVATCSVNVHGYLTSRCPEEKHNQAECQSPTRNVALDGKQGADPITDQSPDAVHGGNDNYAYNIIAVLFAGALLLANAAYMYLNVPLIQMLKAASPASTFLASVALNAEAFSAVQLANVLLTCIGVFLAAYGATEVYLAGLMMQLGSIVLDSFRCALLQRTMQRAGANMNPMAALAAYGPRAALVLILPTILVDVRVLWQDHQCLHSSWILITLSCALSVLLNACVCALIGATSALTTSISGIIKDVVCIIIAVRLQGILVTHNQWIGYGVALIGLCWHHYRNVIM